ncbi:MAG TPA: hypothetical protein VH253_04445 [Phycisphaerae bacterium]|nr:hypothetical protein [Phycisphaerae bacterium]
MAGYRTPGIFCQITDPIDWDDGTLSTWPQPIPGSIYDPWDTLEPRRFTFPADNFEKCCDDEGEESGKQSSEHPKTADDQADASYSGKAWVDWANIHAKNSQSLDDLDNDFKPKAQAFIKALEDAGADVTISATRRDAKRAYLFHWSWLIALRKITAKHAEKKAGVPIIWDHGNDADSIRGAQEMVHGFHLSTKSKFPPNLNSNHIRGLAVDMDITWDGTLDVKTKDGKTVSVPFMTNVDKNTKLHAVGATYGVKKLVSDPPHWSSSGG